MSTSTGTLDSSIAYFPFGDCRFSQGTLGTDKKFTGQRLDGTGLYYYNARYYDPLIGRFISADSVGQKLTDPQSLNRYTYCLNNPLKYTDPTGHWSWNWNKIVQIAAVTIVCAVLIAAAVASEQPTLIAAAIGGAVNTATYVIHNEGELTARGLMGAYAGGAVAGVASLWLGPGVTTAGKMVIGAVSGVAGTFVDHVISGREVNGTEIVISGVMNGLLSPAYQEIKVLPQNTGSLIGQGFFGGGEATNFAMDVIDDITQKPTSDSNTQAPVVNLGPVYYGYANGGAAAYGY